MGKCVHVLWCTDKTVAKNLSTFLATYLAIGDIITLLWYYFCLLCESVISVFNKLIHFHQPPSQAQFKEEKKPNFKIVCKYSNCLYITLLLYCDLSFLAIKLKSFMLSPITWWNKWKGKYYQLINFDQNLHLQS